jgi:flagellar protein FlbD
MIQLTRLRADEPLFLNEDLIERLEGHHETTVWLTNGDHYVVTESPREIFSRIVEARAITMAAAHRLAADPKFDHEQYMGAILGGE